jgi:hypothetical protein
MAHSSQFASQRLAETILGELWKSAPTVQATAYWSTVRSHRPRRSSLSWRASFVLGSPTNLNQAEFRDPVLDAESHRPSNSRPSTL